MVACKHGVIVSAIGSVRNVTFSDIQAGAHLPITEPRMPVHSIEGPLDLIGIEGNLVPGPTAGATRTCTSSVPDPPAKWWGDISSRPRCSRRAK